MARLLRKHGVLYQHIPRTGGSWIEQAIHATGVDVARWIQKSPAWLPHKHSLLSHYYTDSMPQVRFVWTVIRHPIAYYESVWKWMRQRTRLRQVIRRWDWHPHAAAAKWTQPDFDDWVFLMLKHEPMWYTRLIEQYVGPAGGEFVDFIGRTETLLPDFVAAMVAFGYGEELAEARESIEAIGRPNAIDRSIEWSPELKAEVLESERLVIDRFYSKNEGRKFYAKLVPKNAAKLAERKGRR